MFRARRARRVSGRPAFTSSMSAPASVCSSGLAGRRSRNCPCVKRRLHRLFTRRVDAFADDAARRRLSTVFRRRTDGGVRRLKIRGKCAGFAPSAKARSFLMYPGVVPQHPPMTRHADARGISSYHLAQIRPRLHVVVESFRRAAPRSPARCTGFCVFSSKWPLRRAKACFGPSEQFTPTASARGEAVMAKQSAAQPVNVLPLCSKVIEQITGRSVFSRAASRAALKFGKVGHRLDEDEVGALCPPASALQKFRIFLQKSAPPIGSQQSARRGLNRARRIFPWLPALRWLPRPARSESESASSARLGGVRAEGVRA